MHKQPIRVLFCDDQPEVHIVCAIQQAPCTFLGKVDTTRELFSYLHHHTNALPEVIFMDARFNTKQIDHNFEELRETLEELRRYPEWQAIRVVILTGVPIRELFLMAFPYIQGFIDKADYQRALPDALMVFTYGDTDTTFFNKFSPWKPRKQEQGVWAHFTELQLSILEDILRGHSDEFIQAKHGMRNHSNLSGRIDGILNKLIEHSQRNHFFANFSDMDKGGLSIRQKFWIMVQICVELRHPAAMEMLGKNGVVV
jgi:DNA-binding NarL/FixJ family response regulator